MKTTSHPRLATRYKLIIWLVVLFVLWQLLQKPSVVDAILAFCFAGVVPGTNVVLSPNNVIQLVAGVLVVGALLLLIRPTVRAIKRWRQLGMAPALAASPITMVSQELRQAIEAAHVEVVAAEPRPKKINRTQARELVNILDRTSHKLWLWAKTAIVVGRQVGAKTGKMVARQAVIFWRWLSPYLWRFDGWLAQQAHRLTSWEVKRLNKHDTARLVISLAREYQKPLAKYRPAVLWADAKRDFRDFKTKATAVYHNVKKSKL